VGGGGECVMDDNLQKLLDEGFTKEQAEKILVAAMEITLIHLEKELLNRGLTEDYIAQSIRTMRIEELVKIAVYFSEDGV
jgi:hypothetical protein